MSQYPDSNPAVYYTIIKAEAGYLVQWFSPSFRVPLDIGPSATYKGAVNVIAEDIRAQEEAEAESQYDPDAAYEKHLENAGYDEARMQEEIEASRGVWW